MKTKKPLVMKYAFDDGEPAFVPVAKVIEDNLYQLATLAVSTGNRKPLRKYCEGLAQMRYEQLAEEIPRELAAKAKRVNADKADERLRPWFDQGHREARTFTKRKKIGSGLLLARTIGIVEKNTKKDSAEQIELLIGTGDKPHPLLNDYRARIYLKNRQN